MSIHALPAQAVLPVLERARELITSGASVGLASVPDVEVGEAIAELAGLEAQAQAWRLALEAEADARALAERDAATGTDAWVAELTGTTREAAAGGIWLARLLSEKYAATRDAFAEGRLRVEQVRVIVKAAEQIPPRPRLGRCSWRRSGWSPRAPGTAPATVAPATRSGCGERRTGCARRSPTS